MILTVKDGKLIKAEGDPDHPITRGSLCPRCLALTDYVYHPDRIIYPMMRDPKDRGRDRWERVTWDEALTDITDKAKALSKEHGPESIIVFGGTGREAGSYKIELALMAFGSPNCCYAQSGWACYAPRACVMGYLMGGGYPEIDNAGRYPDRYDHPGWEPSKYIILWGKEPLKSNPDGFWGHSIIDLMRRGSKVIVIDPRVTWLGTRADMVLQLRPGTDAALALGMLNVIINEDLYDHDFVEKWTYGFDALKERVQDYPLDKVSEITWVPKDQIIECARKFATSKHSSIGWGLPVDQNPNGVQIAQCIVALLAITDNFDVPGGCTLGVPIKDDIMMDMMTRAMASGVLTEDVYDKRIGAKEYPGVCNLMNTTHPDATLDLLETDKPYKARMAFFQSSNVISAAITASPQRWYEALKKLDLMVVSDIFMTPTAMALCDVFLPVSTYAEHDGVVRPHYGLNSCFYGAINKAIQVGECKSDVEIMIEIGKRMFPESWPFEDAIQYHETYNLPTVGFREWNDFRDASPYQLDEVYRKYEKGLMRFDGEPGFMTSTGRIELYSNAYYGLGDDPLPYYEEPPFSPLSTPELCKEYPLILTTGSRTFVSFHTEHRQIGALRAMHPDPLVEIHPDTANSLGIKNGDWVWIENQVGRCQQRALITETIDPRVVHAEHGWWYPEKEAEEPSLYGCWDSNINQLMPHKVLGKMGFGDTFKNQICKIYKTNN
jgi:anaerobic selenocysteine-containing dehydrogenase